MKLSAMPKWLGRWKYVILVLLCGIFLMLLPAGNSAEEKQQTQTAGYSLEETQSRLEELLQSVEGVGRVRVMLTPEGSSRLSLAQDLSDSRRENETKSQSEILTINRGSGQQEVVITEEIYPTYRGAVVVCDGADNSRVKLSVTETVSVLTGLGSDRISIVKWQS